MSLFKSQNRINQEDEREQRTREKGIFDFDFISLIYYKVEYNVYISLVH